MPIEPDYQAGRRANEIMQPIVESLSKDQMKALAQVFGAGQKAAGAGQFTQCHLGDYNGNSRTPRLAGQNPAYLQRTMLEFKDKTRLSAPDKGALFRAYEDADIEAMANFMAGM